MAKKKENKINLKWWMLGLVIVLGILTYTLREAFFWKTYESLDFGFKFGYPANWHVTPDVISKEVFDKGNYRKGDFDGFAFNIDSKTSVFDGNNYKPSLGDVEVSIYKAQTKELQVKSRPTGCVEINRELVNFSCITNSGTLYIEKGEYVYQVSSPIRLVGDGFLAQLKSNYYHWLGLKIVSSFQF